MSLSPHTIFAPASPHILLRLLRYMTRYWLTALIAYVCLIMVTVCSLVVPLLTRKVIDQGIARNDLTSLRDLILLMIGITILKSLFAFGQGYCTELESQSVAYAVRNDLYRHIQRLPFSFHDTAQTGQIMTRVTSDVEMVRVLTGRGILQMLNFCFVFGSTAVMLFFLNWKLALIAMCTLPALLMTVYQYNRTVRPMFFEIQGQLSALASVLQEMLTGIRVVKAFAREPYEQERFDRQNDLLYDKSLKQARAAATVTPLLNFWSALSTVMVIGFGGALVINGSMTVGTLVAFNSYMLQMIQPVRTLGFIASLISRASASGARIFEILDTQPTICDRPGARDVAVLHGDVAFEHVSFGYGARTSPVLNDITFHVQPGQVIALLGTTGSGKSTIINLLPRFYDVTSGRILVDGIDIRDITLASLRRQIGAVLQETTLFTGTIRDNIAFGRPGAPIEDVIAAARAARAHEFISAFPNGYDSVVGERGVGVSGGQRQRIAIARALLMDARILVLDDASSSVDMETEYLIQEALTELMRGRTTFIIAQRLATIRNADMILVLDHGAIVARGTHAELSRISDFYNELVKAQARQQQELVIRDDVMDAADDRQDGSVHHESGTSASPAFSAPVRPR